MALCDKKSCAYNEFGECALFKSSGTEPCQFYKFDIFAASGNCPAFWTAALLVIVLLFIAQANL